MPKVSSTRLLTILIFSLASIHLNSCQEAEITSHWNDEVTIPDPQDGSQKLSFKTPKLNEEEENSPFITDGMKCDSCQAVAVQLHRAFEDGHKHRTNQDWRMSEATIIDKTGTAVRQRKKTHSKREPIAPNLSWEEEEYGTDLKAINSLAGDHFCFQCFHTSTH